MRTRGRALAAGLAIAMTPTLPTMLADETPVPLEWRQWEKLPDARGRKGLYAGVSGGHVLLAGGSNFPKPLRDGGRKTFHRDAFVRPLPLVETQPWRVIPDVLPEARGEGAAVTTPWGVVALGGHDGRGPVADVMLLRWDAGRQTIDRRELVGLPEPVANAAAVYHDGWIYVAGGEGKEGALGRFRRLDVRRAVAGEDVGWEALPAWTEVRPGAAAVPAGRRFGCILNVVTTAAGPRLLLAGGLAGPAKSQRDYLRDAVLFDPTTRRWSGAAEMPRGAVLGAAVSAGGARVLVLGGSDGHDFERMKELGERYRIPSDVLVYDAAADRWTQGGTMPLGVVGAAVVDIGGSWLVAGGEYSPGLRTAAVYELKVGER